MRTQAVILKKIAIREYDELIICYTKDSGKQIYQAKGILRSTSKQAGHLDILNLVDFSLVHKNSHSIITSAYCLEAFPQVKVSLPAMSAAYFLLECFDKLIFENEPDPKLWDFFIGQLRIYNNLPRATLGNRGWPSGWASLITNTRQELLKTLGYNLNYPIEQLANSEFRSLQFARSVVKLKHESR